MADNVVGRSKTMQDYNRNNWKGRAVEAWRNTEVKWMEWNEEDDLH